MLLLRNMLVEKDMKVLGNSQVIRKIDYLLIMVNLCQYFISIFVTSQLCQMHFTLIEVPLHNKM